MYRIMVGISQREYFCFVFVVKNLALLKRFGGVSKRFVSPVVTWYCRCCYVLLVAFSFLIFLSALRLMSFVFVQVFCHQSVLGRKNEGLS